MPEEILYITFIAMVAVIMVNIVCAIDHKKAEKDAKKWEEIYYGIAVREKKRVWKHMGAYEAPEKGQFYLDLEGIRLVIENGEIEGWYEP